MSTIEIRRELLELINNEDDNSLKNLYQLIKAYKRQRHLDKMIADGEEDVKAERIYSQSDVQKMIDSWN